MVAGVFASALVSAALTFSVLSAPASPVDSDPVSVDDPGAAAIEALSEVRNLLEGLTSLVEGASPETDLTLALRDLALLKDELPLSLQPMATSYLARPTDGDADEFGDGYSVAEATPVCSAVVCVHYVTTSQDKVPAGDSDVNGVPDYVDFTLATMTHVHNKYVGAGYRAPRSDLNADNNGGNAKPDIYLANVGAGGLYGYCASDKNIPAKKPQATWGFCVLDNDYSKSEFSANTPKQNLQVTAAHEYFHAIQFGYDISEDGWVMEATATWAEDEVFDKVDDNVQYLRGGPMALPHESMDQFTGGFHYGTWIFFRYLTERVRNSQGGMPVLVRELWRRLDDAKGGVGDYSLQGLVKVLEAVRPLVQGHVRPVLRRQPYAGERLRRGQGQPLSARATRPRRHAQPPAPQLRVGTDHPRPPGRRHGALHARQAAGQGLVPPGLARHGGPLEGQPRGRHDPAAQRSAEDEVAASGQERQHQQAVRLLPRVGEVPRGHPRQRQRQVPLQQGHPVLLRGQAEVRQRGRADQRPRLPLVALSVVASTAPGPQSRGPVGPRRRTLPLSSEASRGRSRHRPARIGVRFEPVEHGGLSRRAVSWGPPSSSCPPPRSDAVLPQPRVSATLVGVALDQWSVSRRYRVVKHGEPPR